MRRAYLPCLACLLATLVTTASSAREDTRTMTCAEAQDLVRRSGAIVLNTGAFTYSQFVAPRAVCPSRNVLRQQFAPTSDNPHCPVGYHCIESNPVR